MNRWGPFFTHSNIKGTDSRWIGWPFWHRTEFADDDIAQKLALCFRQIGAAVVRISGRAVSSYPPQDR